MFHILHAILGGLQERMAQPLDLQSLAQSRAAPLKTDGNGGQGQSGVHAAQPIRPGRLKGAHLIPQGITDGYTFLFESDIHIFNTSPQAISELIDIW
jgi:hypothetical protein